MSYNQIKLNGNQRIGPEKEPRFKERVSMVQVKYSLEEFIHDMTKLVEEQPDQEKLFDVGSSHLERLVTNPDAISEEYRRPVATTGPRAGRGSYV